MKIGYYRLWSYTAPILRLPKYHFQNIDVRVCFLRCCHRYFYIWYFKYSTINLSLFFRHLIYSKHFKNKFILFKSSPKLLMFYHKLRYFPIWCIFENLTIPPHTNVDLLILSFPELTLIMPTKPQINTIWSDTILKITTSFKI